MVQCETSCHKEYCTHVKYESPFSSDKKVKAKVKVFQKQGSSSRGQKLLYQVEGLVTRNTKVQYETQKALSLLVIKLWPRLKFFKSSRVLTKGETITRVNGNVSFTAGKRLQNF